MGTVRGLINYCANQNAKIVSFKRLYPQIHKSVTCEM